MALQTPGVEATLEIKIHKSPKDWPDLTFTTLAPVPPLSTA